ncbi:MAG: hypothetical protein ACYTBJ_16090 [Planctomycetota bacterium]|jgi:hypothetical protein
MSSIDVNYREGQISGIAMLESILATVTDCRIRNGEPFIGITIHDDQSRFTSFLPEEVAISLCHQLNDVFNRKRNDDDTGFPACELRQRQARTVDGKILFVASNKRFLVFGEGKDDIDAT